VNELEIRANAMLAEVRQQRDFAYNRCASLCADLAIAAGQIEALQKQVADLMPKPEPEVLP
jgi:hypothetical protein